MNLTANLFTSTRLSEDNCGSSERPQSVNLNETGTIKSELTDNFTDRPNGANTSDTVKVFLRLKPRAPKAKRDRKIQDEMYIVSNSKTLLTKFSSPEGSSSTRRLKTSEATSKKFCFTKIFSANISQDEVFKDCTSDTILDFLSGKNSTVMTYGTTDSGKTFTLYGTLESPGIIPRTIESIFSAINCTVSPWYKPLTAFEVVHLDEKKSLAEQMIRQKLLSKLITKPNSIDSWKLLEDSMAEEYREPNGEALYSVWLSFAEIYNENIYDLLGEVDEEKIYSLKLVTDKHGRSFIPGQTRICVTTGLQAYQVFLIGQSRLSVLSGLGSSLSHSIFSITLLKYFKNNAVDDVEVSTLTFCDLAGTGRNKVNTTASGGSVKEARNIKTGILALGRCLQSVYDRQSGKTNPEVIGPFRESKLTRFFQKCLLGKERFTIIATVNPTPDFYVENQRILHVCSIAKKISNTYEREFKKNSASELAYSTFASSMKKLPKMEGNAAAIANNYDVRCAELEEQNTFPVEEIEILRSNTTSRELIIQEEMDNFSSTMIEDIEVKSRTYASQIEEDQAELFKLSVNPEIICKKPVTRLINRKRKRTACDDELKDFQSCLDILEAENAHITRKYISTKEILEHTKEECNALRAEKNTCVFKLGLANEELRKIRDSLALSYAVPECKELFKYLRQDIREENEKNTLNEIREKVEAEDSQDQLQNSLTDVSSIFLGESLQSNSSDSPSDTIGPERSVSSLGTDENRQESPIMEPASQINLDIYETIDKTLDLLKMDKPQDSGISVSRTNSINVETQNKSIQTLHFPEGENRNADIEKKLTRLKSDYKGLQSEHLQGSIRINELSKELEHIRRVMNNLKDMMCQSDQKIVEYQVKLASQEVDLENLKECNIELERNLSRAYLDQEKSSLQCIASHIPKINKLSREIEEKSNKINSLNQRMSSIERDLQMVHNLEDKVSDFSHILEKCKREKEELRKELQERLLSQSSLEGRLRLLSSRVQDRENEITSLRTDLAGMVRMNTVNGERVNELGEGIANALDKLTTVKEEMRRSEVERRELERTSSHEISNLAARFKQSAVMLNMIHEGNDDVRGELERMKSLVLRKDREFAIFKKNRESTIQRYESLVRKLQEDVRRHNRELLRTKRQSKRAISKESLKSVEQESSREVPGDSLIKRETSKRTFNIKNRRSKHHYRLTCSTKRLSSHIVTSLTSLQSSKSNNGAIFDVEEFIPPERTGTTNCHVLQADSEKFIVPREATTPSMTSSSDDSDTDYRELSNWMKVKPTNGRTQFVIHQAAITVENAAKKSISES